MKIYREVGSLYIVNRKDAEGYERPVYEIEVDEAEPIVRCKECKHWTYEESCGFFNNKPTCFDDFCSYGERREP